MDSQTEKCPTASRPAKRQIALFLDPDLIAFADAQARLNHESRGQFIRRLIRRELNTAGQGAPKQGGRA